MRIKNKLLVCVALLGFLFLTFTGSASAAEHFPTTEAGISAYVKAAASIPNLDVVKPCLTTIIQENKTAGYIIGTVAMSSHTEEEYPHVYVSTDGWVVAYYPNDRPSSWLVPWVSYPGSGPITTTTLKEAIEKVIPCIGGTTVGLKYYDFRYPDATKMMIITEPTTGSEWFKLTIPSIYTLYRVDWIHWCKDCYQKYESHSSSASLEGTAFSTLSNCDNCKHYGSFDPEGFTKGVPHTIQITTSRDTPCVSLVLEYAE
jgi:hypothetical protein